MLVQFSCRTGSNRYLTVTKKNVNKAACSSVVKLSSNASQQIEHLLKKFPLNIKERQELQPRTERSTVSFDSGWAFCCLYCLKSSMFNAYADILVL